MFKTWDPVVSEIFYQTADTFTRARHIPLSGQGLAASRGCFLSSLLDSCIFVFKRFIDFALLLEFSGKGPEQAKGQRVGMCHVHFFPKK